MIAAISTGRPIAVAFGCLVLVATSASAECAWVKWWTGSDVDMTRNILDAFPRLPDCDQSLKADVSRLKRDGYAVHGAPGVGHGFSAEKGDVKRAYHCLPDTVDPRGPHAGDLPNITVDATGRGHLEVTNPRVTLERGSASLLNGRGTALVVHEGPDDMRTDPDGNSGPRIACGVIVRGG